MAATRKTVFLSYAHEDRKWDQLLTFLAPWIRDKRVDLWDDSRIKLGDNWQAEIHKAIEEAAVAVLLVTKDFLASDFITKQELPGRWGNTLSVIYTSDAPSETTQRVFDLDLSCFCGGSMDVMMPRTSPRRFRVTCNESKKPHISN